MTPILLPATGSFIFLMQAESGILVTAFERTVTRERTDIYDAALGYDVGFIAFNPSAAYTVRGRVKASPAAGVGAAAPGVAITLGNISSGNGVTAGGIYCTTVTISHAEKGTLEVAMMALQKPGIT